MDWARDNAGVSEKDLENVFRYEEKPATVVRMLGGSKVPHLDTPDRIQMLTTCRDQRFGH
jgi:hypothetical protein